MPKNKFIPIVGSFQFGEVSPRMWGRLDTRPYKAGAAFIGNMIPDPRGALVGRPGFRLFADVSDTSGGKIFAYVNVNNAFVLYFTADGILRIYDQYGNLLQSKNHPYAAEHVRDINFYEVVGEDGAWILHNQYPPQHFDYNTFTFKEIAFVNQPSWWGPDNYPSCAAFFQGRSWMAGFGKLRETFISSKSGNFYNLQQGADADSAMQFTIAQKGNIMWLSAAKNLIVGTDRAEYLVMSSSGIITPNDAYLEQQSAHGSAFHDPVMVGNNTVFITEDREHLKSMSYKWTENGYFATDVSFVAQHIMHAKIDRLAFTQDPDPILWMTTRYGYLWGCSYIQLSPESKDLFVGWHRTIIADEDLYNGWHHFEDVCAVDYKENNYVLVLEKNSNGRQIYVMNTKETSFPLDRWVERKYSTPTSVIEGLPWLKHKKVQVMTADGQYIGMFEVDKDWKLTLPQEVDHVFLGVPLVRKVTTLPVGIMVGANNTLADEVKHLDSIQVMTHLTAPPQIGCTYLDPDNPFYDRDDIFRPYFEYKNDPYGLDRYKVQTWSISAKGWSRNVQITIRQDLPYPLEILRITGVLKA